MKGAREYARLFKTGQYGRLYITSGSHARGLTFRIQILPEGEDAISNGSQNLCLNENAVLVYGVISGNPGWTESYGWIHKGKWVEDFENLVRSRQMEIDYENSLHKAECEESANQENERIKKLLESY
jgi:hypothetical protein